MNATMQESNRVVGIISSDSHYFFYIITVKEKSHVLSTLEHDHFKVSFYLKATL